ncbi:MAG: LPP20 family lipoprotein [Campylobacterota bacterium]|nr:LPP20 family lipoprotein [Campylobacterota bacterium]
MRYFTLLLITIGLLLSGCGAEKKIVVAKPKMIPTWYSNPPKSNATELYAMGEGKNQKDAITNALTQMASTLSVSVSSTFNAKTVVKEGSKNSPQGTYTNETQSKVKEIRISSYELLQSKSLGFKRYGVLVKSNKKRLFESMDQEIKQNFSLIKKEEVKIKEADAIGQLAFYRTKRDSLASLPNTLIVMNVLNPSFDGDEYIRKTQEISWAYQDIVQNISFHITSNKDASNLKSPIAKGISAKHLRLKNSQSKMNFRVHVNANIQKADSYGFTLARSEISIVTKDYRGVVVGSNAINIVGQSSQGFDIAKQDVANRLNAMIEKEGIAKVLGLDI